MSPRASLPGADELFRNTSEKVEEKTPSDQLESTNEQVASTPSLQVAPPAAVPVMDTGRQPRHEEKVTFYCTAEDLTRLERARLGLRADHKVATDRGKIVRAALSEILDDFESRGGNSSLVRRLQQQ